MISFNLFPFLQLFRFAKKSTPTLAEMQSHEWPFVPFFGNVGGGASDLLSWQTLKRSGKLRRDGGGEGMSSKRQHKRFPMMQMEEREEESNFPPRRFPRTHAPLGK